MKILSFLVNILIHWWDRFDRWLCHWLPGMLRFQWARLWVRKNEFHPSLNPHADYYYFLPPKKKSAYWADLARRRQIAHERDLKKSDQSRRVT